MISNYIILFVVILCSTLQTQLNNHFLQLATCTNAFLVLKMCSYRIDRMINFVFGGVEGQFISAKHTTPIENFKTLVPPRCFWWLVENSGRKGGEGVHYHRVPLAPSSSSSSSSSTSFSLYETMIVKTLH